MLRSESFDVDDFDRIQELVAEGWRIEDLLARSSLPPVGTLPPSAVSSSSFPELEEFLDFEDEEEEELESGQLVSPIAGQLISPTAGTASIVPAALTALVPTPQTASRPPPPPPPGRPPPRPAPLPVKKPRRPSGVTASRRVPIATVSNLDLAAGASTVGWPKPLRPLPVTADPGFANGATTSWQIDPSSVPWGIAPSITRDRGRFRSYEQRRPRRQSVNRAGMSSRFLHYAARGTVRPHQEQQAGVCSINGVRGTVHASDTPYNHTHIVPQEDLDAIYQASAIDIDHLAPGQAAEPSIPLRFLPGLNARDGHQHIVNLSINQAKAIANGQRLTTHSSGPLDPNAGEASTTIEKHFHVLTVGCD